MIYANILIACARFSVTKNSLTLYAGKAVLRFLVPISGYLFNNGFTQASN